MGQEGSESTTVKNPSFLRRVAAGLSTIYFYVLSGLFDTANPEDHLHHSVGDGSKVDQSSKPASEPDLEAYAATSDHFSPSIQSSTQSRSPELQVLPLFHRSPDSPHLDQPNMTHLSNPVAQAFREVELSKAFLPFIMPIATILLTFNKKDLHELLLPSVLCLICAALVALFYGNSFRNMLPKIANAFEQFGTA
ncbi:hypothetical protein U1Q18_002483, partial [Sarracenia purpurea var. burkii]